MGSEVVTPQTDEVAASRALAPASEAKVPVLMGARGVQLGNLAELYRFAQAVVASQLVPKGLDTPEKVLVAIQWGAELGLTPMASCRGIHVIEGMPSLSGQLALGLCWARGAFGKVEGVSFSGDGVERVATFRAQRKGQADAYEATFSIADATRAGLIGDPRKKNWISYPDDMLQWRAIGRWIKRYAPDIVLGLPITEEAIDYDLQPRAPKPPAGAGRHPVLARLVGAPQPVEAPAKPAVAAVDEQAQPRPEADPVVTVVDPPFSASDAQAAILAEAARRVGKDKAAVTDLVREVTGGLTTVTTRDAALEASAKLAAHPIFGDK